MNKLKTLLEGKIYSQGYTSIRNFTKTTGIPRSPLVKTINGQNKPSKETLTKWCTTLNCTREESVAIFHAAGFLSPEEMAQDDEQPAA